MPDRPGLLARVKAKIRALLPEHWRGEAGRRLRETIDAISQYSDDNVRIRERIEEAPDLLWNTAKIKSSQALVNAADEEQKRIAAELARRTLPDKTRQEKATADRMETEARTAKIKEMEERLSLVEKLRGLGVVPVWDTRGGMAFLKAPPDLDWDGLMSQLLTTSDLSLLENQGKSSVNINVGDQVEFSAKAAIAVSAQAIRPESIPSSAVVGTPGIVQESPIPPPATGLDLKFGPPVDDAD